MKLQIFISLGIVFALSQIATAGYVCTEKVCEFHFDIKHARTMSYRYKGKLLNLVFNGTDLAVQLPNRFNRALPETIPMKDVITADGFARNILTVNDQFPGPTIEVMQDAEVVIHVTNYLLTQGVSIHWHGQHQRGTPWMDGVSHITQCPTMPGQSFTYRFKANPVGTHWYHDHLSNLRTDGVYGMFVVHAKLPSLPEKHLLLSDWYHEIADTIEINSFGPYQGVGNHIAYWKNREFGPDNVYASPFFYVSALINGQGQWNNNKAPLSTHVVKSGDTYRFRTLNAASTYGFEISIDGHVLEVVALDGNEINPVRVDSIMLNPAERVDFTVVADRPIGNYWMRSLTLRIGVGVNPVADGIEKGAYGIVRYEGAAELTPATNRKRCTAQDQCIIFNCPWPGYADSYNTRCIDIDEARSVASQKELDEEFGLSSPVDLELFLNIGFHREASINGIQFKYPTLPWSEPNYEEGLVTCDQMACGSDAGCTCSHVVDLPYNKTVQMIMANYRPGKRVTHHPMHLHGHNWAVVKQGFPTFDPQTGYVDDIDYNPDVRCTSSVCNEIRWNTNNPGLNLVQPPVKDTINIPARGYVAIRFRTTNPGPWLFHCHISNHLSEGMAMVFDEAPEKQPPPPSEFPRCPSFQWSEKDFRRYMALYMETEEEEDGGSRLSTELHTAKPPPNSDNINSRDDQDEKNTVVPNDNSVTMSSPEFIGLIIGCIATGAALVVFAMLFLSCRKNNTEHKLRETAQL